MNAYEVTYLKNGKCAKGTAAALSLMTGVAESKIIRFAKANAIYQERYLFRSLSQKTKKELMQEFVEVCKIYAELKEGKRKIQKAADGKL